MDRWYGSWGVVQKYAVGGVQVQAGGVGHDASKVRVYGDGVKPTGVLASLPVSFTVDTSQAGVADVDILIEVCHFYRTHEP